jgi:hypothetical protein
LNLRGQAWNTNFQVKRSNDGAAEALNCSNCSVIFQCGHDQHARKNTIKRCPM